MKINKTQKKRVFFDTFFSELDQKNHLNLCKSLPKIAHFKTHFWTIFWPKSGQKPVFSRFFKSEKSEKSNVAGLHFFKKVQKMTKMKNTKTRKNH